MTRLLYIGFIITKAARASFQVDLPSRGYCEASKVCTMWQVDKVALTQRLWIPVRDLGQIDPQVFLVFPNSLSITSKQTLQQGQEVTAAPGWACNQATADLKEACSTGSGRIEHTRADECCILSEAYCRHLFHTQAQFSSGIYGTCITGSADSPWVYHAYNASNVCKANGLEKCCKIVPWVWSHMNQLLPISSLTTLWNTCAKNTKAGIEIEAFMQGESPCHKLGECENDCHQRWGQSSRSLTQLLPYATQAKVSPADSLLCSPCTDEVRAATFHPTAWHLQLLCTGFCHKHSYSWLGRGLGTSHCDVALYQRPQPTASIWA